MKLKLWSILKIYEGKQIMKEKNLLTKKMLQYDYTDNQYRACPTSTDSLNSRSEACPTSTD